VYSLEYTEIPKSFFTPYQGDVSRATKGIINTAMVSRVKIISKVTVAM
jgi:hypothetical protein